MEDSWAAGWKEKIIGLRVLSEIKALKIAVDVGLVTGVTPAMTPTGSEISTMPSISSRRMTPTDRMSAFEGLTGKHAKMVSTALTPNSTRPDWAIADMTRRPRSFTA